MRRIRSTYRQPRPNLPQDEAAEYSGDCSPSPGRNLYLDLHLWSHQP
jgi:hypothetical protein